MSSVSLGSIKIRPSLIERSVGIGCAVLFLIQLYFYLYPTTQIWYWPAVLFYAKVGAGLLGLGTFVILAAFTHRYFLPRHYLAWAALMMATISYTINGFGTEYVALIDKPQIYIEQADRIFLLVGSIYAAIAASNKHLKWLTDLLKVVATVSLSSVIYTVFVPASWPHLQIFSPTTNAVVFSITIIGWLVAGLRFWKLGRKEDSLFDWTIGLALIASAVMTGMRFFEVWHPLWMIWHLSTALAYFATSLVLTNLIRRERKFQVKPYFVFSLFTLIVPVITIASALAGYATWRFGARSLQAQADAFGYHVQTLYTEFYITLDHKAHDNDSIYNTSTYASVEELRDMVEAEAYPFSVDFVDNATFAIPATQLFRTLEPGVEPRFQLIGVVPLTPKMTIIQPVTVVTQDLSTMAVDVARVRLLTMVLVMLASSIIFYVLWRIITVADNRIVSQEKRLKTAVAELRAAEQGREDLTNMIVHDLRSPLSAIVSSLQLLERMQLSEKVPQSKRLLGRAATASDSMRKMISDMLNISKMEQGQLQLAHTSIYVPTLFEQQVLSVEDIIHKENKTIEQALDLSTDKTYVLADPEIIQRVLDNLISNALRYTTSGGTITLKAEALDNYMCIEVQDTGVGISKEKLPQIFEKFTQASEDSGQRRKGVGLGLAFCKLAVEAHGGSIWVESEAGVGSTFKFTLPLALKTPLHIEKVDTAELQLAEKESFTRIL